MSTIKLVLAVVATLLPTAGGSLSGIWTGPLSIRQDDGSLAERGGAYLQLQQQGKNITGSVGPSSSNTHPVEKASFTLGELKFSTHYIDPDSKETVNWSFDLTVDGDSMHGTGTGSRGDDSWTVELKLRRQSSDAPASPR